MSTPDAFDCRDTDFPICPHCGCEYRDTTEFYESEDFVCDECGREMHIEVAYEVSYMTTKN